MVVRAFARHCHERSGREQEQAHRHQSGRGRALRCCVIKENRRGAKVRPGGSSVFTRKKEDKNDNNKDHEKKDEAEDTKKDPMAEEARKAIEKAYEEIQKRVRLW